MCYKLSHTYFSAIVHHMKHTCDMCLAVIAESEDSVQFCNFCFKEGQIVYATDDVHAFRKRYFEKLSAEGSNEFVARFHTLLIGHAPYWKARRG